MGVYQLLYYSKASREISQADIDLIIEKANEYNDEKDISGVLMYHSGVFLQFIEGEKQEVLELYRRIQSDERHKSVIKLAEIESEQRIFPDWNMGYCTICDFDPQMAEHVEQWRAHVESTGKIDLIDALKLLNKFKSALRSKAS